VETIGSKRSYALIWCMPNNDDDDDATASQAYVDRVFSLCGLLSTWWRNRMSQPLEIREFLKLIDASIKCSRICKPHTITVTYDLHIHF